MKSRGLTKLITGLVVLGLALIVFISSGSGESLLSSTLDPGKLGSGPSEMVSRVIEVILSIVTALASTGLLSRFKWFGLIVDILSPLMGEEEIVKTPEEKFLEDSFNLLRKAIYDKKRELVIMLVDEIAGTPFMEEPSVISTLEELKTPTIPVLSEPTNHAT